MEISPEEVNEYVTSFADLVIRKDGVEQPVKLAVVSLERNSKKECLAVEEGPECFTGMVAELKLDKGGNHPYLGTLQKYVGYWHMEHFHQGEL